MIGSYSKRPKDPSRKFLGMITTVIKYQDINKISIQKPLTFLYTNCNNSTQNTIQKIKNLGKSLTKAVKDLYNRKI